MQLCSYDSIKWNAYSIYEYNLQSENSKAEKIF